MAVILEMMKFVALMRTAEKKTNRKTRESKPNRTKSREEAHDKFSPLTITESIA